MELWLSEIWVMVFLLGVCDRDMVKRDVVQIQQRLFRVWCMNRMMLMVSTNPMSHAFVVGKIVIAQAKES